MDEAFWLCAEVQNALTLQRAARLAVGLLELAREKGAGSREAIEAIVFLTRLWTFLLEDLAHPENAPSPELRARLISIGIWNLRECERLRRREAENLAGLIDVMRTLAGALA